MLPVLIPTKTENKFRQNFEKMEGFSFVTPVTGLNRPNTRKEDDDEGIISEESKKNHGNSRGIQ
jgi:hypothetical protein